MDSTNKKKIKGDKEPIQSVYGSFFEYSNLKPNPKKQFTESLFSDLVSNLNIQRTNHIQIQYNVFNMHNHLHAIAPTTPGILAIAM